MKEPLHHYNPDFDYYPFRRSNIGGPFLKCLLFIILILLIFFNVWLIGYNAGINEIMEVWPDPTKIEHQASNPDTIIGEASWYDYELDFMDENGYPYSITWSKDHRTAASRDLPKYSYAKVTNVENGKEIIVYINDYGPEKWTGRVIDLSSYAFSQISDLSLGVATVIVEPYESN